MGMSSIVIQNLLNFHARRPMRHFLRKTTKPTFLFLVEGEIVERFV